MNHSGDAAEQIVRMSLEGVEVAAKITGSAAKEIALFLIAALKSKNSNLKLKGKARMASMLKSGKALEIFSVKDSDLQKFAQGAKQYGIVYCVLRNRKNTKDGLCDIMVKADDAPKISRVVERFKFATVDKAKIESEIVKSKEEKAQGSEPEAMDKNDTEKLVADLIGMDEGKAEPEKPDPQKPDVAKTTPAKGSPQKNSNAAKDSPFFQRGRKTHPSEPISENRSKSAGVTSSKKPSVKEEIREIKAGQAKQEAETAKRDERQPTNKAKANRNTTHKQPENGGKSKTKKSKERS